MGFGKPVYLVIAYVANWSSWCEKLDIIYIAYAAVLLRADTRTQ